MCNYQTDLKNIVIDITIKETKLSEFSPKQKTKPNQTRPTYTGLFDLRSKFFQNLLEQIFLILYNYPEHSK